MTYALTETDLGQSCRCKALNTLVVSSICLKAPANVKDYNAFRISRLSAGELGNTALHSPRFTPNLLIVRALLSCTALRCLGHNIIINVPLAHADFLAVHVGGCGRCDK